MLLYHSRNQTELVIILVIVFPLPVIASFMGWLKEGEVPQPEKPEKKNEQQ